MPKKTFLLAALALAVSPATIRPVPRVVTATAFYSAPVQVTNKLLVRGNTQLATAGGQVQIGGSPANPPILFGYLRAPWFASGDEAALPTNPGQIFYVASGMGPTVNQFRIRTNTAWETLAPSSLSGAPGFNGIVAWGKKADMTAAEANPPLWSPGMFEYITIEAWGAGGGARNSNSPGGGGGYAKTIIKYPGPPTAFQIVVGRGGVCAAGNCNGNPGTLSRVSMGLPDGAGGLIAPTILVQANGGQGGQAGGPGAGGTAGVWDPTQGVFLSGHAGEIGTNQQLGKGGKAGGYGGQGGIKQVGDPVSAQGGFPGGGQGITNATLHGRGANGLVFIQY